MDVVGFGPSVDDDDHRALIRAFPSLEERTRQEDAFYGSDEWKGEHRAGIMALIETDHTVALETTIDAVDALRHSLSGDRAPA